MSIKTIDKQIKGSAGVAKRINKGAEKMVFDILQSTQYSMPVQSTIRELVTNACDSQREKEVAIEILKGKKKIEDYYIERHGPQYEDSNFNINYYNLESLNIENNQIELMYHKNEGLGYCDLFEVNTDSIKDVDLFFYDGPHDLQTTRAALIYYSKTFADTCICIFDDANWEGVVHGANEGIQQAGLKVLYNKKILNDVEDKIVGGMVYI